MSLNLEFVLDMFPPNPTASAHKVVPFPGFQPGGMAEKAVHELRAPEATVAHAAFAVLLLTKLAQARPILWVGPSLSWYPPGLAWLGLDPARCLFAKTRNDAESLGMLEVALRGGIAGVAECAVVSRLAARRLALAAQSGGSTGFLLRHAPRFTPTDSTAFATRWMICPAPTEATGTVRLRAELLYAKGGLPGVFTYEIKEAKNGTAPPAVTLVDPGITGGAQRRAG
jgi:protein ImuA